MNSHPDHHLCLFGDYNLPYLNWSYKNALNFEINGNLNTKLKQAAQILQESFSLFDLKQHYPVNPSSGYTLDLLFSTLPFNTLHPTETLVSVDPNHPPSYFTLDLKKSKNENTTHYTYNFKNVDFEQLNSLIESELQISYKSKDINEQCESFYSSLHSIIDKYVPKIPIYSSNFPRWYSPELKHLIVQKKIAHKKWKITRDLELYIEFKRLRAICLRTSILCKENFIKSVETHISKDPKLFWNYYNSLLKPDIIPTNMIYKDKKSNSNNESSNLFKEFFESFYKQNRETPISSNNLSDLHKLSVNSQEISRTIKESKNSYEVRIDGIPSALLINCHSLIPHLHILFNSSLHSGKFPDIWKQSIITPIYKHGLKDHVTNYRPITQIPAIAKILDKIVSNKLSDIILHHIIRSQHGFVPGKSIITNLLFFNDFISNSLNDHLQVDVAYMDFSKAFDSIDHALLIKKLEKLNLNKTLVDWIISYLINRQYRILLNNQLSVPYTTNSGVPQGSHLGPLLFILFINDITTVIRNSNILLFADDIKIYKAIKSPLDCLLFQEDLSALHEWSNTNLLPFNLQKCNIMSFLTGHTTIIRKYKINYVSLPRVTKIRDLGITYNTRFNFDDHIQNIIAKSNKRLGILKYSAKNFKNTQTFIQLYKSMILPLLIFGSIIWSPQYRNSIYKLEKVQHKFLRALARKTGTPMEYTNHDYTKLAKNFNIPSLESLHRVHDMILIHKCIHHNYLKDGNTTFKLKTTNYSQRRHFITNEIPYRTNDILHSTTYRLRKDWNNLANELRCDTNLTSFTKNVKLSVLKFN